MMTKIRSILVATDLTPLSDEVVRAAGGIAAAKGAELHVLHAFDFPDDTDGRTEGARPASFQDRIGAAEKALEEQVARAVPAGVTVASRRVEIFVAHRAIIDAAQAAGAELVVMGAHSRERFGDELLGSTADRVIRSARVPCLVVRAPLPLPLRRVVVPVDLSSPAISALEIAMRWSLALGAADSTEVIALHVIPSALDLPDMAFRPEEVSPELHREVSAARVRVPGADRAQVREEVRWGDNAVEEILGYLSEAQADLVALGTHGHGLLKRALIGSVASGVARRAPCPVLLVPPALWEAGEEEDEASAHSPYP